ncbi:MAG: GDP-mannose 4,6-dehydratase [Hallerella porci]|uniref:GDP-4-dehydro-6-deoxy-D-mannose reductase n=1 Tax=Hallerella porci TaxID=1945871 RepID=A0ABX5LHP8_9BACT|nr:MULTISPECIES: GDP-mannose 4,6-dehydratase [Hallerella]MCI5600197.1 GDP-mannose 4,6-dehydratase [Hallerella sp.]MDY3920883.1 GDP-mannose 4,6-dehydratase [Hallerella porci]PWK92226.1 GDP-4-dehydro-6-deoxy-D-mannose reductase [Hallerella porci]
MSILVTGGTGALGFHILSSVTRNGEKLYSFSDEQPQPWQKVSDVNYRTGDLLNFKDVLAVMKEINPRAIYHLASQSSVELSYKKPYETLSTNLLGTQNLLEAARQVVPEAKILLLSSSEVYGRTSGTLLTTLHKETDRPNPLTPYATSKACMELLGNQFTNAYGMHIVTIRPFYFTGPHHSRRFSIPSIASQVVRIKKYGAEPIIYSGSLDVSRDVLDVRDVARGLIQVLQAGNPGEVYNICSGKSYTVRELTETLVDIADIDVDFCFDPAKERSLDIPLLVGDPSKIMDLGWKPMITIEDCLQDLYNEMIVRLRMEREMKTAEAKT